MSQDIYNIHGKVVSLTTGRTGTLTTLIMCQDSVSVDDSWMTKYSYCHTNYNGDFSSKISFENTGAYYFKCCEPWRVLPNDTDSFTWYRIDIRDINTIDYNHFIIEVIPSWVFEIIRDKRHTIKNEVINAYNTYKQKNLRRASKAKKDNHMQNSQCDFLINFGKQCDQNNSIKCVDLYYKINKDDLCAYLLSTDLDRILKFMF